MGLGCGGRWLLGITDARSPLTCAMHVQAAGYGGCVPGTPPGECRCPAGCLRVLSLSWCWCVCDIRTGNQRRSLSLG